jgi:hypothetical protein
MHSNTEEDAEFIDFGCLLIPPHPDLEIQVDIDTSSDLVTAISLVFPHSVASIQVFASATNEDAWPSVRDAIVDGLTRQHVDSTVELGMFGTEIHCVMPTQNEDGTNIVQPIRFVGIDGPRWFLRAAIGGDAAVLKDAISGMDDFLATLVVVRGVHAMAPGEPLVFSLPTQ